MAAPGYVLIALSQSFELHCNQTTQTSASFSHEIEKVSAYHSIPSSPQEETRLCPEMPSLSCGTIGYLSHCQTCK